MLSEAQPQILRLRWAQKTRPTSLRMTAFLWCGLRSHHTRRIMHETTAQTLERVGLIPVLRARNAVQAHAVVQAMLAGGVTVVEVTMTVPGAVGLLKELKNEYGTKCLLGSGTVTTADQAQATIDAGAEFVVSPSLHPAVIARTKANSKLSIPGALTPT